MIDTLYRQMFTDDEWNAIFDAMGDYQDYGDHESSMSHSVKYKIHELFKNDLHLHFHC